VGGERKIRCKCERPRKKKENDISKCHVGFVCIITREGEGVVGPRNLAPLNIIVRDMSPSSRTCNCTRSVRKMRNKLPNKNFKQQDLLTSCTVNKT